jgi:hypothetical protein
MIPTIGLSVALLAATGWVAQASAQAAAPDASAPAADSSTPPADSSAPAPKPAKHHHTKTTGVHRGANTNKVRGDAAVEDLNAQSLDAAKTGKAFTPPTSLPASASKPAGKSTAKSGKSMHHHHKKAAAPAPADSSAPPADSSK